MAETLELIHRARAALGADAKAAYDTLSSAAERGPDREEHIHPILMALSGAGHDGADTRAFLTAEPRWASFLANVARDPAVHAHLRVRSLALLSRIQAPEPREMVLDFADHDDMEDLAEIVLAYKDPALVEALIAKAPKRHHKDLAMFLGLPKPKKPATSTPQKTPAKPRAKKKPATKR